jgi:hypothetical protein
MIGLDASIDVASGGSGRRRIGQVQPRQTLIREYMAGRFVLLGSVERADMEMSLHRKALVLACQSRAATDAEASLHTRRGAKFGDLAMSNADGFMIEGNKDGGRRAGVFATALAMAPKNPIRLSGCVETHRAAQATALI